MNKDFPLLCENDQNILNQSLVFLKMNELRTVCAMLSLPESGKKTQLIQRILVFIQTGTILRVPKFPVTSLANNHPQQTLSPNALMLYGNYKNDTKTRNFFKHLIGPHFHYTAYGIDWLNDRWLEGKPPTYQEFANFWIQETHRRSEEKAQPKEEWAYINFVQDYIAKQPTVSKMDLLNAWKKEQAINVQKVYQLVNKALDNKDYQ